MEIILKLKDGGLVNISSDTVYHKGSCDTCDFDSEYSNQYTLELTKGLLNIEVSEEYDYPLSDGLMIKLILSNVDMIKTLTEQDFIEWVKVQLKELAKESDIEFYYYKRKETM